MIIQLLVDDGAELKLQVCPIPPHKSLLYTPLSLPTCQIQAKASLPNQTSRALRSMKKCQAYFMLLPSSLTDGPAMALRMVKHSKCSVFC